MTTRISCKQCERSPVYKKSLTERLGSVTYTYIGTDQEFDEFLKMLVHDYLAVDQVYIADQTA